MKQSDSTNEVEQTEQRGQSNQKLGQKDFKVIYRNRQFEIIMAARDTWPKDKRISKFIGKYVQKEGHKTKKLIFIVRPEMNKEEIVSLIKQVPSLIKEGLSLFWK